MFLGSDRIVEQEVHDLHCVRAVGDIDGIPDPADFLPDFFGRIVADVFLVGLAAVPADVHFRIQGFKVARECCHADDAAGNYAGDGTDRGPFSFEYFLVTGIHPAC